MAERLGGPDGAPPRATVEIDGSLQPGGANATLAAWLALRDALPGSGGHYQVSQGREVGHDARLHMQVDADGEVWAGGQVVSVVRGTIDWR